MSASSSSTSTFNSRGEMIEFCAKMTESADIANNNIIMQPTHASERPISSSSSSPSISSISIDGSVDSTSHSTKSRTNKSTQKAKKREQTLRDDPFADVQSPYDVVCKRCGSHIKLSGKSTYDPFHWYRHKNRCTKRPETTVKALQESVKEKGKERRRRSTGTNIETGIGRNLRPRRQKAGSTESTPPLTPDESDDAQMVTVAPNLDDASVSSPQDSAPTRPASPSPSQSSSRSTSNLSQSQSQPLLTIPLPQTEYGPAFEEYLARSRRRLTKDLSPFTLDNYQAWTWSQLKEPVWVLATYPHHQSQGARSLQARSFDVKSINISP